MKRILIAGIRAPIAHDLIDAFIRDGYDVYGADCFAPHTITKHLYKNKIFTYCPPALKNNEFENDCRELIETLKPDLIIPLNEEVYYWAKLATQIDIPLFAPKLSQLMALHSKFEFAKFCQKIGLKIPKTEIYEPDAEYQNRVFKPEFSRFGEKTIICPKARPKFNDAANRIISQEFIEGEDVSFYAITIKGKITAFSAYKSDWRANGGAALLFKPIFDPELFAIAEKIAVSLDLTGQFSCDLRQNSSGEYFLIECNPRGTSGLHNIARQPDLTRAFFDQNVCVEPNENSAQIGLAMLVYGFPYAIRTKILAKFFKDFSKARDVFKGNVLNLLRDTISYFFKANKAKMSISAFLTHDIECNRNLCE